MTGLRPIVDIMFGDFCLPGADQLFNQIAKVRHMFGGDFPVLVPPFMEEIVEEISRVARGSRFVDHASGVSARLSIANYRTMVANARRRGIALGERPAVPRVSDLAQALQTT